jgi:cell filamentation protein
MQDRKNTYEYLDDPDIYLNPKTGVLWNIASVITEQELMLVESIAVAKRLQELSISPISIGDSKSLLKIHRYLFQDVYTWAGEIRKVNISKNSRPFLSVQSFTQGFEYIDNLLEKHKQLDNQDKTFLAKSLANILDSLNFLHPFREGNGRAQREFIRSLVLQKGYEIDSSPSNNYDLYKKYMMGTVNGNLSLLEKFFEELLNGG